MPQIDAIFTAGANEIARVPTPMSFDNLDELSQEMGHSMAVVSLPAGELANALQALLASNASPEGDWLIEAARLLLVTARAAIARGATGVTFAEVPLDGEAPDPTLSDPEGVYSAIRGIVYELAEAIGPARAVAQLIEIVDTANLGGTATPHTIAVDAVTQALYEARSDDASDAEIIAAVSAVLDEQDAAIRQHQIAQG